MPDVRHGHDANRAIEEVKQQDNGPVLVRQPGTRAGNDFHEIDARACVLLLLLLPTWWWKRGVHI